MSRPPRDARGERLALEELHDEIVGPVLVPDVVECADVRVLERGDRLGLALEAGLQLGIGVGQDLDRDGPIEAGVVRAVDLAESAGADQRHDLVGPEPESGAERHGVILARDWCPASSSCLQTKRIRLRRMTTMQSLRALLKVEPREPSRVGQDLDRHVAIELRVARGTRRPFSA